MKGIYNLRIKKGDTLDIAREKNDKLINMVKKLERKVSTLGTNNVTLQSAFDKTQVFLRDVTKEVKLLDIINQVKKGSPLRKTDIKCPNCQSGMKKIESKEFYVVLCNNCDYRSKVEYELNEES